MSDDTSAALERLKEIASRRDDGVAMCLWSEEARTILAHIAKQDADIAALKEAIFGGADYDASLGIGTFCEMARATEAARKGAVARAEWAEAFGHVFHTLPDGRLDFVAVREGSELGKLHQRADALAAQVAGLREAVTWLLNCHRGLDRHGHGVGGDGHWGNIDAATAFAREALAAAPAAPDENRCGCCGRPNPVWFAPNVVWNRVMGGPDAADDPGGNVCPICFIGRAERAGMVPTAWVVQPEPPAAPAPTEPESRERRLAKLERLLREARADVEYIADAESGSAEGAASRDLLADIDAALAEAEGRE